MIELVVYPKGMNPQLINPSLFCSKSEIFIRLTGIDFKISKWETASYKLQ